MRIGIDATAMPLQRTGAGNYIFNLIRALARYDAANEYVVFLKADHARRLAPECPNVRFVERDFSGRGMRLLWEQLRLPAEAHTHGLDLLHSPHYTMPLRRRGPSVVTFHDATFLLYPELHQAVKRMFFPRMVQRSARRATHLIAVSESTRADIIAMCQVPPDRITAIPLAADASYAPPTAEQAAEVCQRYGIRARGYLLFVGVLEPRKQVDRLVDAFGRVVASLDGIDLLIAGRPGWMFDQIHAQVAALGLRERVRFTGYVPQEDLPGLYGGALGFVYPSKYEGFGLPVLEAMSCGAAVITTTASSLPEVAGDAALLVGPDDVEGLANALLRVARDGALREQLSSRAIRRARAFSWERSARETVKVYERARVEAGIGA